MQSGVACNLDVLLQKQPAVNVIFEKRIISRLMCSDIIIAISNESGD